LLKSQFSQLPDADVIVAPVIEARCFCVRVSGHALRDLDPARPLINSSVYARDAESLADYHDFNSLVGSTASHHVPEIGKRDSPDPTFSCQSRAAAALL
jgi:hypothetical protein